MPAWQASRRRGTCPAPAGAWRCWRPGGAEREAVREAGVLHDWRADPWSLGACSYAAVGGQRAHQALARPVEGTLFFAGEATSADETGTVSGAIRSGRRVAREAQR